MDVALTQILEHYPFLSVFVVRPLRGEQCASAELSCLVHYTVTAQSSRDEWLWTETSKQ